MGIELRPLGVACNLGCVYCYQDTQREAGNISQRYDLAKMKAALLRANQPFTVFGGEPLLVPLPDLEELFALGLEKFGHNSIQTNGTLVTEEHLRLFRTYKVSVGISIDGPDELNDLRWHRSLEQTRHSTAAIEAVIARLCAESLTPGLIVTLHRGNATPERLPRMHAWVQRLEAIGVRSMRLHLLEVENEAVRTRHALSLRENFEALLSFQQLQSSLRFLRFDLFAEMEALLLGRERGASCVWHNCDPYRTSAVVGIEGNGQSSNCGRTNKDGVDYTKADAAGYERYIALWRTPQAEGGCQDCRFFLMCRGQCPGTAIDGDWRNRSELCEVWKALFSRLEQSLILQGRSPQSLNPRRREWERSLVESWERGRSPAWTALAETSVPPAVATPNPQRRRFTRLAWVSDAARERWEPRLARVREALLRVAIARVADGHVSAIVRRVPASLKAGFVQRATSAGLAIHELDASTGAHVSDGRMLVGTMEALGAYLAPANDQAELDRRRGQLLGYPICCIDAHLASGSAGCADPLWPAIGGSNTAGLASPTGGLQWPEAPLTHILLRRLGLGLIAHIPCGWECAESRQQGAACLALGQTLGVGAEMEWLQEMLRWPLQVSVLHGIAEIRTPVFKLACDAPATAGKLTARYLGGVVPEGAARGRTFPFLNRRASLDALRR